MEEQIKAAEAPQAPQAQIVEPTQEAVELASGESVELEQRTIVRVTKVTQTQFENKNRYYIELSGKPFLGYNKDGSVIETNTITMNINTLAKQIGAQNELLNVAVTMATASGKASQTINPTIVALCLTNSIVDITRIHKLATDTRDTGNEEDTYGKNTWKNVCTKCIANVSPIAQQMLLQMIMNPATLIVDEAPTTPKAPTTADLIAQALG